MFAENKNGRLVVVLLACVLWLMGSAALAAEKADGKPLHLGGHLGINYMNTFSDLYWYDIYADETGFGTTLSFDVSYRFTPWFSLHSGVGLDYRYFGSDYQERDVECLDGSNHCEKGLSGYDKDYLLYLEVPFLAQLHFFNVIYFEVGPVFDFLLMRKSDYFEPEEYRTDKCLEDRNFGTGISVGVGHEFASGLFVDLRVSYQVTGLSRNVANCGDYDDIGWEYVKNPETGVEEKVYHITDYPKREYKFGKVQLGVGYWF